MKIKSKNPKSPSRIIHKPDGVWWEVINALTYNAHVFFVCKECQYSYGFYIGINDAKGEEFNCCVGCYSSNVEIKSIRRLSSSYWKRLKKEWESCPTTDKDGNRLC